MKGMYIYIYRERKPRALGKSTLTMLKEGQSDCSPVSKGEYGNQIKLEKLAEAKPWRIFYKGNE